MGKHQQECDYQLALLNSNKEIERLKAQLAMQAAALESICGDRCNAEYNPCEARQALNATAEDVVKYIRAMKSEG